MFTEKQKIKSLGAIKIEKSESRTNRIKFHYFIMGFSSRLSKFQKKFE
uniref:Uncharacterized protein n=1 Tax=Rhizophora mucronata TaxID=61149 RepID=A0A2P2QTN1_RHIMU